MPFRHGPTRTTQMKPNGAEYQIIDLASGRQFRVECIGKPRTEFGDSLDNRCAGSITEKESRLTEYCDNPMDAVKKALER